MANSENKIFFNFSYFALKLLGKGLYSNPWTAIAELVANGLDAKANNVKILIDMSDKQHSIIEIFDNGIGMDYDDLAGKYVLIGRNKRNDMSLDETSKEMVMGRKGIGKLAALYLSNRYYLISKTKNDHSAWFFDMSQEEESEIPSLNRVEPKTLNIQALDEWARFETGTMIKLENVDLTNIGIQTIEGLKARLSDYYLLDSIQGKIELAVRYNSNEPIIFTKIEKNIAFKNFYALFDNSDFNIYSKMLPDVYVKSNYEEVKNKRRKTVLLENSRFDNLEGEKKFLKENGEMTSYKLSYKLTGWIGIHTSIDKEDARINDSLFLKNKAYKSTQLRLYVRNKLAVENFMPYLKNTQAFANYIEGEISFDILDNNELGDIATSNRQGFSEDDERVTLLIEILQPIVRALIAQRINIGQEIKTEEKALEDKKEKEKKHAEEARIEAEKKQKHAEAKQRQAEEKYEEANKTVNLYRAQNNTLFSTVSEDQERFTAKTHLVKTNAITIRNNISTLASEIGIENYRELGAISIAADKILSVLKYSALAKFNIEDEYIEEDLFDFCREYLEKVLKKQYYGMELLINVSGKHQMRFNPQNISLILDNLMSNCEKNHSTKVEVEMMDTNSTATISFSDNGNGFGNCDINQIFEFGISNTGGTGIGLYNVKKVVEKMNGEVFAENNVPVGARIIIKIR